MDTEKVSSQSRVELTKATIKALANLEVVNLGSRWQHEAACRGMDAEHSMFFDPVNGDPSPEKERRIRRAKAICETCTVKYSCLLFAITKPKENFGIWGGLTEDERRAIK